MSPALGSYPSGAFSRDSSRGSGAVFSTLLWSRKVSVSGSWAARSRAVALSSSRAVSSVSPTVTRIGVPQALTLPSPDAGPGPAAEPERSGRERSGPDRCRPRRTPTERGTRGVRERACGGVPGSLGCVPAVDRERDAGYEACASAAEPEHGSGHLAGLSESRDRLVGDRLVHVELAFGEHVRDHRRLDRSRADRVDADAAGRVLERGTLCEAEDAVFGGVVGRAARQPDQATKRRAVDDCAASLLAHLTKLVLHASPDAAEVDRVHAVEGLGRLLGGVRRRGLDPGVVEGEVEPAESRHATADEHGDLLLVRDVTADTDRLVARGGQLLSRGLEGLVVAIGQDNGGASLGERLRRRESHSRGSARDQRHAIAEVVGRAGHGVTMTLIDSRSAIAR